MLYFLPNYKKEELFVFIYFQSHKLFIQPLPNQSILFWSGGWVLKPNEKRVENHGLV